jgi:hypothetical protein
MTLIEFSNIINNAKDPVILIEGRRSISSQAAASARMAASFLAGRFPQLKFRSGNASGSDEAFTAGVLEISPERLQIIAPYASHRKRQRHPLALYESPESLSTEALEHVKVMTVAASPGNKGLVACYQRGGKLGSQAACLIRDTMKVAGIAGKFDPPTAALFYIDPANPEAGGTGHTIRVCRNANVPVVFQDCWESWI